MDYTVSVLDVDDVIEQYYMSEYCFVPTKICVLFVDSCCLHICSCILQSLSLLSLLKIMNKRIGAIITLCLLITFLVYVMYVSNKKSRIPRNYTLSQSMLLNRNFSSADVVVFLHIQKTGGTTFGKHLVNSLDISHPCSCVKKQKRCICLNHKNYVWLFSRYSTGWLCGLHADWTELKSCVNVALDSEEDVSRQRKYIE